MGIRKLLFAPRSWRGELGSWAMAVSTASGVGVATTASCFAAPSLDLTFGGGGTGYVQTDFGGRNENLHVIAIQPDAKVIAAGKSADLSSGVSDFTLVRYLPGGLPDPAFGASGKVSLNESVNDTVNALALLPDGKILIGGSQLGYELLRLNPNGSRDPTFGVNGHVLQFLGNGSVSGLHTMAVLPDGHILAAGTTRDESNIYNWDFSIARFNSNGSTDTSFGTSGAGYTITHVSHVDYQCQINALQVLPDGKILATGSNGSDCTVVRYLSNGAIDPSFGVNGIATADAGGNIDNVTGIFVRPDGRIVLGGDSLNLLGNAYFSDFAILGMLANGAPDPAFPRRLVNVHPGDYTVSFLQAANGDLILVSDDGGTMVAFKSDGSRDSSFGVNGVLDRPLGMVTFTQAAAMTADQKIILGANTPGAASDYDYLTARFESIPEPASAIAPLAMLLTALTSRRGGRRRP